MGGGLSDLKETDNLDGKGQEIIVKLREKVKVHKLKVRRLEDTIARSKKFVDMLEDPFSEMEVRQTLKKRYDDEKQLKELLREFSKIRKLLGEFEEVNKITERTGRELVYARLMKEYDKIFEKERIDAMQERIDAMHYHGEGCPCCVGRPGDELIRSKMLFEEDSDVERADWVSEEFERIKRRISGEILDALHVLQEKDNTRTKPDSNNPEVNKVQSDGVDELDELMKELM